MSNTDVSRFRCIHKFKAGRCRFCNPKRPLGKRTIILDSGPTIRVRKGMYRTIARKQADHIPEDVREHNLDCFGVEKKRQKKIVHYENLLDYLQGVDVDRINRALHHYENS